MAGCVVLSMGNEDLDRWLALKYSSLNLDPSDTWNMKCKNEEQETTTPGETMTLVPDRVIHNP